ncbi:hypothetical protein SB768_24640 [Burkholderia sp. SIMBA_043]|nr:hypothetical protein [Burkholderia vietnamiensis]MDN7665122.1 hypothetical protein [Burkholderia vietnamiensis]
MAARSRLPGAGCKRRSLDIALTDMKKDNRATAGKLSSDAR